MSEPVFTIKATRDYTEDETVHMWLSERGYVAVRREIMSQMGGSDYQRDAGRGPITIYNMAKDRYEMHPELIAKLRREGRDVSLI